MKYFKKDFTKFNQTRLTLLNHWYNFTKKGKRRYLVEIFIFLLAIACFTYALARIINAIF